MATFETLTAKADNTPLDMLLLERFQREVPGLVEATLAINPGLADLGPFLGRGTTVRVQIPEAPQTANPVPLVTLYD